MGFDAPHLQHPPIVQVICGILFTPVEDLDPLGLGIYWNERVDDYPTKSLQLALVDASELASGFDLMPMRAVFVGKDDQFLLQLQRDRFFVNWRKRGARYPRFSTAEGVLSRTETEFRTFRNFVSKRFGKDLDIRRIDASKIDLLTRGAHWQDLKDLAELIPLAGVMDAIQQAHSREFNLTFVEHGELGDLTINLRTLGDANNPTSVRIESRVNCEANIDTIWRKFGDANAALNHAFFKILNRDALGRFDKEVAR